MMTIQHKFVEFIPNELEQGVLYISFEYCTAVHRCICGCGNEVVTPISPTDWQLTFDGKSISLNPSIGNWNFPCRSHYWIKNGHIKYASSWSQHEIDKGRKNDAKRKKRFFSKWSKNKS